MSRIVVPEILDELPPADPAAIRSRRDLRLINKLMGGQRWILNELSKMEGVAKVIELGAGDGELCNRIKQSLPACEVAALDIVPRPQSVRGDVSWISQSVLDFDDYGAECIVIANLFIHHLQDDELALLGEKLKGVRGVLFAEPYRSEVALYMSKVVVPFVNYVTRHDMPVSIRAGFTKEETAQLLGSKLVWEEGYSLFGGIRMKGMRE